LVLKNKRPLGVTAIASESIAGAIVLFLGGLILGAVSSAEDSSPALREEFSNPVRKEMPAALAALDFGTLASMFLIMGAISIVQAYGLLTGRGWAWTLALIACCVSIAISILFFLMESTTNANTTFNLALGVSVCGLIIYYLNRSSVRNYFGRAIREVERS
jgi:uncharacterized membrane protein (DUF2068 family)